MNRTGQTIFKIPLLMLPVFICAPAAHAQQAVTMTPEPTLEQKIPDDVIKSDKSNIITLVLENDLYGDGTDSNYSNGVRLSYLDLASEMPGWLSDVASYIPGFKINKTTSFMVSAGQNLYTPDDITQSIQNPNDRPWAAFLYGSMGVLTIVDNHIDEIELTAGVVGPAALGRETQTFIHEHISDSPKPRGWDNQLKNEPALMLGWQREWPEFISSNIGGLTWALSPYIGTTIGNVYTYGDVGISMRLGPHSEKWQDTPTRVRPAMPGSGFFEVPVKKWSWYVFGGIEGRAVARNIFLDGNTFTDSHNVDKNWAVADANAGLAFTYDQFRISYTAVYRTKEFETQDDPEVFGAITMGYRF